MPSISAKREGAADGGDRRDEPAVPGATLEAVVRVHAVEEPRAAVL